MTTPLPQDRRAHVAQYARGALVAAGASGVIPTPLADVTRALALTDPQDLYGLADLPPSLRKRMSRLAGKVVGAFAVKERTIFIDRSQAWERQRFTHGHELGHQGLPWHAASYYADDHHTLNPDTYLQLEAEASAYSAELLFSGREFTDRAHSSRLGLALPLGLADEFQTSRQAAIRRYVEDSPRPCALIVFGRYLVHPNGKRSLKVLNVIESATFTEKYGSAAALVPTTFVIGEAGLAADAYTALTGHGEAPVLDGQHVLLDSRRGTVALNYEVYSNTYFAFGLLYPRQRMTLQRRVSAAWTTKSASD